LKALNRLFNTTYKFPKAFSSIYVPTGRQPWEDLLRPLDEPSDAGASDSVEDLDVDSEEDSIDMEKLKAFKTLRTEVEKLTGASFSKTNPPDERALDAATKKLEALKVEYVKQRKDSRAAKVGSNTKDWLAGFTLPKSSKRDSLTSLGLEVSSVVGNEVGADTWGAASVDPSRFKPSLTRFIKHGAQKQLRFGSGDPHDGYLGLFFLENATHLGERSLDLWLAEVEEELKANNKGMAVRSREVYELRFRVFETMRCLRSATCVNGALSGSDSTLEVLGRWLFTLSEVLAGNMEWSVADLYLPVGSVKSASYAVPAAKLRALGRNLRHSHRTREAFKGVFTTKDKTGSA
jgi:hypothetical protein